MHLQLHPPTYFVAAVTAMSAVDCFIPGPWKLEEKFRWLAAIPLLLAGVFALWSIALFLRRRTSFLPYTQPAVLLTTGPYRITRNPLYLSMVLALVAVGIGLGTATCWLIIPAFVLCIDRLVIPWEDRTLEARFGDDYRRYRSRVGRWIGLPDLGASRFKC